jgi:hypothetical protein
LASDFVFHIRNAHPGDMAALLATLEECPGLATVAAVVDEAEKRGFAIRDRQRLEALITARDLGLVDRSEYALSDNGRALGKLEIGKPELFPDIVHGLQYTLWDQHSQGSNCFSWSYRAFCEMLWNSGTQDITDRRDMASSVESRARTEFGSPEMAFSPKSIGGALLWLAELEPRVFVENDTRFTRRSFCAPELFVLGVDFVYRIQGIDHGTNLLLSEDRRDTVCQVCLLEPGGFDRVLEYAVSQFDYLEAGLGGGWGRYLTLRRVPRLEDFQ